MQQHMGGHGGYGPLVYNDEVLLSTCVWRDGVCCTASPHDRRLFRPHLPDQVSLEIQERNWTGKRLAWRWAQGELDLELRSCLPGPWFQSASGSLCINWASGNDPDRVEGLDATTIKLGAAGGSLGGGQVFLIHSRCLPTLLVANRPLTQLRSCSHRHWTIQADGPLHLLFAPLLHADDIPDRETCALWRQLISAPPLRVQQSFCTQRDHLVLHQQFPGAALAPLPPLLALLGTAGGYAQLPSHRQLLHGLLGPYAVVAGQETQTQLCQHWQYASLSGQVSNGDLPPAPEELAYAGDWTWDEQHCAMDQLLALRQWCPLLPFLPDERRVEILARLQVPSRQSWADGLQAISEPFSQQVWLRERALFEHHGEVTYDMDWYNGRMLAGLARACQARDPSIAQAARHLAQESRDLRDGLVAYLEIFHDWALGSAWTDPRGCFWLLDCVIAGLEGLLAEADLRDSEGRDSISLRGLAAAGGAACLAVFALPAWRERLQHIDEGDVTFRPASQAIHQNGRVDHITCATRNPYCISGHIPWHAALLREHGPRHILSELCSRWELQYPERYRDWIAGYLGEGWQERFHQRMDQEARVEGAHFYHLAPDLCLRWWVLGQSETSLRTLWATPLPLASAVLLSSKVQLTGLATQ